MAAKPLLKLLRLERVPILEQLKMEETLFRQDCNNWLILNYGAPPSIVLGISGAPEKLVDLKKLSSEPIPLIRRFSGGGTVVVDEETLFVTFICRHDAFDWKPYPQKIMEWTASIYSAFLPKAFSLRENDYTFDHLKWGGNAQSITKDRWLHHSSLLWDFSDTYMSYLLQPEKAPDYRKGRQHLDFLCRLKEYFACKETFQEALIEILKEHFSLKTSTLEEIEHLKHQPCRRVTQIIDLS